MYYYGRVWNRFRILYHRLHTAWTSGFGVLTYMGTSDIFTATCVYAINNMRARSRLAHDRGYVFDNDCTKSMFRCHGQHIFVVVGFISGQQSLAVVYLYILYIVYSCRVIERVQMIKIFIIYNVAREINGHIFIRRSFGVEYDHDYIKTRVVVCENHMFIHRRLIKCNNNYHFTKCQNPL